jgi:hypothetical protein
LKETVAAILASEKIVTLISHSFARRVDPLRVR